jgi:mono/diheme cytochrome c family protein
MANKTTINRKVAVASGLAVLLTVASSQVSAAEEARSAATEQTRPPYYRIVDGKVDKSTYLGWRVFHSACFECHGVDAIGTDLAPDLTDRIKRLTPDEFTTKVITRYHITAPMTEAEADSQTAIREAIIAEVLKYERGERGAVMMPAWDLDPGVKPHVMDLYAYLTARADGALGPGRPELIPGELPWMEEKK